MTTYFINTNLNRTILLLRKVNWCVNKGLGHLMKKKVLVVDDEPGIVKLLSIRLKVLGYAVCQAFNGLECVEIAKKEIPDLILLDIKMPHSGGIDAFKILKRTDKIKNIPVIFMTAYHTFELNTKVLKMGAKECISKPFFGNSIYQTIGKHI